MSRYTCRKDRTLNFVILCKAVYCLGNLASGAHSITVVLLVMV